MSRKRAYDPASVCGRSQYFASWFRARGILCDVSCLVCGSGRPNAKCEAAALPVCRSRSSGSAVVKKASEAEEGGGMWADLTFALLGCGGA